MTNMWHEINNYLASEWVLHNFIIFLYILIRWIFLGWYLNVQNLIRDQVEKIYCYFYVLLVWLLYSTYFGQRFWENYYWIKDIIIRIWVHFLSCTEGKLSTSSFFNSGFEDSSLFVQFKNMRLWSLLWLL